MDLPTFRYHPDPVGSGAIVESSSRCPCCNKARGYAYAKAPYAVEEIEDLCPWCIADGSAAQRFDATFSDSVPLIQAGVPRSVIDEVCQRTPGFFSWQGDWWLSHCNDACAFIGDATAEELRQLDGSRLDAFLAKQMIERSTWEEILDAYEPGGSPAVYSFRCLHCGQALYYMDSD